MKYEFEIPGKVTGKGRPRVNTNTGMAYTPTKTRDYEDLAKQYFLLKYPRIKPLSNRVSIEIIAYFEPVKTVSKIEKEKMLEGTVSPTKKPDIDNIAKIILDSLNGLAFIDDTQVTKISVEKKYSNEEKVYVKIEDY